MGKILWNNVCLLNRMEQRFIEKNTLQSQVDYYGLGRETDIQQFLKNSPTSWDIIVSTDIEIFYNPRYLPAQRKTLRQPILSLFEKETFGEDHFFSAFIAIPLVLVVRTDMTDLRPQSLKDLSQEEYKGKIIYGGINNSAGKSLLKSLWAIGGKMMVEKFLENSWGETMPAAAFKKFLDGQYPIAVVPSLFAKRQGLGGLIEVIPEEGAIAIPSFVAVHKNCNEKKERQFTQDILMSRDFHNMLFQQGRIVSSLIEQSRIPLYYPPQKFLNELDHTEWDNLLKRQNQR